MKWKVYCAALLTAALLAGCASGVSEGDGGKVSEAPEEEVQETVKDREKGASEAPKTPQEKAASLGLEPDLLGEWEFMCGTSSSTDSQSDYFYMEEDEPIGGSVSIYEEEGGVYANVNRFSYESAKECYHIPVTIEKGALYPECENQDWYAVFTAPHSDLKFEAALTGENILQFYREYQYDLGEGDMATATEIETFVRKDSPEAKNPDQFRYSHEITVSTAEELLNAISSNTSITMKAGEYNLSEVRGGTMNRNVYAEVDKHSKDLNIVNVQIREVSNLRILAEEGAEVEICINDPYSPVLELYDCSKVTLKGLRCGHHVEPGYCSGSVLSASQCYDMTVSDCRLYGSGTYGIETDGGSEIKLSNTEIYDCTYGIGSFMNTSNIRFTDCNIHDNCELSMLYFNGCYDALFENCRFSDNKCATGAYGAPAFVTNREGGAVTFEDCSFENNEYAGVYEGENVETKNCTFPDKELGFG